MITTANTRVHTHTDSHTSDNLCTLFNMNLLSIDGMWFNQAVWIAAYYSLISHKNQKKKKQLVDASKSLWIINRKTNGRPTTRVHALRLLKHFSSVGDWWRRKWGFYFSLICRPLKTTSNNVFDCLLQSPLMPWRLLHLISRWLRSFIF